MSRTQFVSGRSKTEQLSSFTLDRRDAIGDRTHHRGANRHRPDQSERRAEYRGATAESTPSSREQQDDNAALFGRCLQDWDAGTHMTKKEWSGACQRLLIERGKQRQ